MILKEIINSKILCISDHGWSPGCVTVGKYYIIESISFQQNQNKMNIFIHGDNGALYKTTMDGFKLASEIRDEKLDLILE